MADVMMQLAGSMKSPLARVARRRTSRQARAMMEAIEPRILLSTIQLLGNGQNITSGATTYSTVNATEFGVVDVNNLTVTETYTIQDPDPTTALSLTGSPLVAISGNNSSDFTVTTQPGSSTVAANNGAVTFTVQFKATAIGDRNALVSITSNSSDTPTYTFYIHGQGLPSIQLGTSASGATIVIPTGNTPTMTNFTDFGYTDVNNSTYALTRSYIIEDGSGSPINLTGTPKVTIGGANAVDFSVLTQPASGSVSSGNPAIFTVQFLPHAAGVRTATVSIANDGTTNPFTFNITGTALTTTLANSSFGTEEAQIAAGTGAASVSNDYLVVNYTGYLLDGTKFDSSLNAGRNPFTFELSQGHVITGWDIGMLNLQMGEQRVLIIPASEAYGAGGSAGSIPGNSPLIFTVQRLNQVEVYGFNSGNYIPSATNTPNTTDGTDFGTVLAGAAPVVMSFPITAPGSPPFLFTSNPFATITGANASEFAVSSLLQGTSGGGSYTYFSVQYTPGSVGGLRQATVDVAYFISETNNPSSDGNVFHYTINLQAKVDTGPVITTIVNQTGLHGAVLSVPVSATNPVSGTLTYSATVQGPAAHAAALKASLLLTTYYPQYVNEFGQNERWFSTAGGATSYYVLPDGTVYLFVSGNPTTHVLNGTLVGSVDPYFHDNPTTLLTAVAESSPVATASFAGNQLTVTPIAGFTGTAFISVTVGDGFTSSSSSFNYALTDNAPVIPTLSNQTSAHGSTDVLAVAATDADADALTYTATIQGPAAHAAAVRSSLAITTYNSAIDNVYGQNEKWFIATGSGTYYYVLSDGTVRQFVSGNTTTHVLTGTLAGTVDPIYYTNPGLLISAVAESSPVGTAVFAGNQLTLTPAATFSGTAYVTVSVSDGIKSTTSNLNWTVTDTAPVLPTLSDQTSVHLANKVLNIAGTDADVGDTLTYTVSILGPAANAVAVRSGLGLTQYNPTSENFYGQGEKWFTGTGGQFYYMLSDGTVNRFISGNATTQTLNGTLSGKVAASYYTTPATLLTAVAESSPVATGSFAGNQLTLVPAASFASTAVITVTLSDGVKSATKSFNWTVTDAAPVVTTIATQTATHGAAATVVNVTATDADGDPLTYTATITGPAANAAAVRSSLGLSQYNPSSANYYGQGEKWFTGTGGQFYYMLSDGTVNRFVSGNATTHTLTGTNVGKVSTAYYAAPTTLLTAVAESSPVGTAVFAGSQLTLTPAVSFADTALITVTVTDGAKSVTTTFNFTVNDTAPVVPAQSNQTTAHGTPTVLTINGTDADGGDTLTYTAVVQGPAAVAAALKASLGLNQYYPTSANYYGQGEKWFTSASGGFYYMLSDGTVNSFVSGNVTTHTLTGTQVGKVSTTYYDNPATLLTAVAESSPVGTASFAGNQLTLNSAAGFAGTANITVTASDGAKSASTTFTWTVTDAAPVVTAIANQTTPSATPLVLNVTATDADADALTYSATVTGPAATAAALKSSLGLNTFYPTSTNYYGQGEKWFTSASGGFYYILSDGSLYNFVSGNAVSHTLTGTLVGKVATSYYTSPATLLTAVAESTPVATAVFAGNQLTITAAGGFNGTALIVVTVSDGIKTGTASFSVVVT